MVVDTTDGPKQKDHVPVSRHVNTSRVVEEDLQYQDEAPEILAVLPGYGWQAVIGGESFPLVAWVALDDAKMYGVVVGEGGRIDLSGGVEKHPGFAGYKRANDNKKEQ